MEIQGKVIIILPEERFNGRNGELVKNQFIIQTDDQQYPKKVKFDVLKREAWEKMNVAVGNDVVVSFDPESREWNGRWFTSLNCWKVVTTQAATPVSEQSPMTASAPVIPQPQYTTTTAPVAPQPTTANKGNDDDDLPF